MSEINEELAIISDIHFGVGDTEHVFCWFNVDRLSGTDTVTLTVPELLDLLTTNRIYKLDDLNGRPCVVEVDGKSVKFLKLFI